MVLFWTERPGTVEDLNIPLKISSQISSHTSSQDNGSQISTNQEVREVDFSLATWPSQLERPTNTANEDARQTVFPDHLAAKLKVSGPHMRICIQELPISFLFFILNQEQKIKDYRTSQKTSNMEKRDQNKQSNAT